VRDCGAGEALQTGAAAVAGNGAEL
jgi:hypothetical protein